MHVVFAAARNTAPAAPAALRLTTTFRIIDTAGELKSLVITEHKFDFLSHVGITSWRRGAFSCRPFTLMRISPTMRRCAHRIIEPPNDVTVPDSDDKRKDWSRVLSRYFSDILSHWLTVRRCTYSCFSQNRLSQASLGQLPRTDH